jgi:CelD/BcsL family acetyltransferase involved in cellulose biosynthesis
MMAYLAERIGFDEAAGDWSNLQKGLRNDSVFLSLLWQECWWELLGNGELHLCRVRLEGEVVGIAPLMYLDGVWQFLGGTDLFDYHECLVREGHEEAFFKAVLGYMDCEPWLAIDFLSLRDDTITLKVFPELARKAEHEVKISEEDVSPGIALPQEWDAYLATLKKKNRHELRRKIRRLEAVDGGVQFRELSDTKEIEESLPEFLRMMRISREDKTEFLTVEREGFFRALAQKLAPLHAFKLFFLEIDHRPAAGVVCFDYKGIRFLYNSGYDPAFSDLSVSLLLKAWCLRNAIETGFQYFDFLRGAERYKYDLGGIDHRIMQVSVQRRKNELGSDLK